MRWFARKDKPPRPPRAKHVEIWEHFVEQNRLLKRMTVVLSVTALLAVAVGGALALIALHRPLVYYVDSNGQASYAGRLASTDVPRDVEARYVAKRFLKHTLEFNSLTIESDLADAWNLMTDELRDEEAQGLAEYEAARGYSFVDFVQDQKIRTVLDFERLDVENHNDKTWAVRVTGVAKTWPLNRVGEQAAFEAKEFDAQLTLVRVPRTELTPNGLLVAYQSTKFFESHQSAQALEHTVPSSPAPRQVAPAAP